MKNFKILYFFCEHFSFEKGVWVGRFHFSIDLKHMPYQGFLHFSYRQSTPAASIQKRYSFSFQKTEWDEKIVSEMKMELDSLFSEEFERLQKQFIEPREKYMPAPVLTKFAYNKKASTKDKWIFHFSLKDEPSSKFEVLMTLEGNTWFYSIQSLYGSLVDYKNSLKWEDTLIEQVAAHIRLVPEIRYQFLYQKMKFKYRKSYR